MDISKYIICSLLIHHYVGNLVHLTDFVILRDELIDVFMYKAWFYHLHHVCEVTQIFRMKSCPCRNLSTYRKYSPILVYKPGKLLLVPVEHNNY